VAAVFSSKKPSLEEARYIRSIVVGCALGYGNPLKRRQSKLTPALLLERRQDRLPSDSTCLRFSNLN
jgi:hypothetical protein